MASHHQTVTPLPRTIASVLLDLVDAKNDWDQADRDAQAAANAGDRQQEEAAGDRMSEADQRIDALREEYRTMFRAATGVSWAQVERAIEGGML